jgi:hypothetical protein
MKVVLVQIAMSFLVFMISKEISDTHFSGSVAGILVMSLNTVIREGLQD